MRIVTSLALCVLVCLPLSVSAEVFDLSNQEQVYACNSQANIEALLNAAGADSYFDAFAEVVNYSNSACPVKGPFHDDRLYGTPVLDEKGELVLGYDRITIVRWHFEDSERNYYSLLVRSEFGIWEDAITVIMKARTIGGILDMFKK